MAGDQVAVHQPSTSSMKTPIQVAAVILLLWTILTATVSASGAVGTFTVIPGHDIKMLYRDLYRFTGRKHLRSLQQQPFCSDARSPTISGVSGAQYQADLSGSKNIQANTTGVPAALETPASGSYQLTIDEQGQRASWTLQLCNIPEYLASHLQIGSPAADYQPPLIALDPFVRPSDPFAPAAQLPQQCPAKNIDGCSYNVQGSFTAADLIPLQGKADDPNVPAVQDFQALLNALNSGNIYVNIRSAQNPTGLIRGNLAPSGGAAQGTNQQPAPQAWNGAPFGAFGGPLSASAGIPGFGASATAPNFASSSASAVSGPGGTHTEQSTYTRGNADADASADANRGGK